jgi:hypothetical protein
MIRNICNYQKKIKKILKLHNNGYTVEIHYSVNKKKKKNYGHVVETLKFEKNNLFLIY